MPGFAPKVHHHKEAANLQELQSRQAKSKEESSQIVREVMDIRQASDYLGISPDTLYKYASEGFIPAFRLGNRWRFKRSRIDEWMDTQSDASVQEAQVSHKKPARSSRQAL